VTDREAIRAKVRQAVYRTLGLEPRLNPAPRRRLVTELDLRDLPFGSDFRVPEASLVTPLARQVAMDRHITLRTAPSPSPAAKELPQAISVPAAGGKAVAIGADHGGFKLKESLKDYLRELGYEVIDCGTNSTEAVDYPDFALAVAELVSQGRAGRGILVDGAGIGSCMAANKIKGIRAALCYDLRTVINSREHNNANVLTLGGPLHDASQLCDMARTWLQTRFGGGRHMVRVNKIMAIERG
jgi:ribose 5-phosphate isomerase B